jgi:hypothetical protein
MIKTLILFLVVLIPNCIKPIKNENVIDNDLISPVEGYSSIDLTHSLNKMNDATEITNEINKKEARPEENIFPYICSNLKTLQSEYNKRMQEIGSFIGSVKFEFQIISTGKVISIKTLSSSIEDTTFIENLKIKILKWNFGEIEDKNDTTKVIYPFVFDYF